ncbi:MAG: SulP family inorganic anion transporter [Burkholderiales bacterium]|nr:SulP family inorganic anion transporter [Burkholderiales bacterium]
MTDTKAPTWLARWLGPWVGELNGPTLRTDALAGLLGAMLVLPQALAFASLAGLPPAAMLASAVLPCIVAALAGSSRHVLTGPTNALSLALGAMLIPLAGNDPARMLALAALLTLLVGLIELGLAIARLGALANFISPSVMLGFMTGAAGLIAWYALASLLGGVGRATPPQVMAMGGVSAPALAVGGLTLALAIGVKRLWPRSPALLIALLAGAGATWLFERNGHGLPRVGQAPSAWLGWHAPTFDLALWSHLLPMALALSIIALGQSMAIAKLLAARSGQQLDVNRECAGQGLANLVGAFSGSVVGCGSLNRSLPSIEAGARTPIAGVTAGLWLLALVALAGPLLAWIPLAGVGALLLLVAWGLTERAAWARLARQDRIEFAIALATALATLALALEVAVLSGVALSLVAYLYRTSKPAMRTMGFDRQGADRPFVVVDDHPPNALCECPQLKLLRMEGSIWFGAVPHVADQLRALREAPDAARHLLVMSKSMNFIDQAGADLWEHEHARRLAMGGDLYFHRPRPQVVDTWRRIGFVERLGADHVFPDKRRAIAAIVERLDGAICARCQVRLFEECSLRPGAPNAPMI